MVNEALHGSFSLILELKDNTSFMGRFSVNVMEVPELKNVRKKTFDLPKILTKFYASHLYPR